MEVPCVIDHVAFEAPAGLEDATRYAFGDDTSAEALTVELEAPAGGATPSHEVLEELRESITTVFPFGKVFDEGETLLDEHDAWFLAYEVGPEDERVAGMVVVANLPDGDFVKLHLRVAALDQLGPRFGPTLESVSLRGAEAPKPAGPDYRRERVGPVALDVPRALLGPRSRLYVDADDRLRLRLTVRPVGAAAAVLEDGVAGDAKAGELLERDDRAWSWGWWVRYRQRGFDAPHRERAVVRAGLTLHAPRPSPGTAADQGAPDPATPDPATPDPATPDPAMVRQVEIHGTAEPSQATVLYAAFDALLSSIRWSQPGAEEPRS